MVRTRVKQNETREEVQEEGGPSGVKEVDYDPDRKKRDSIPDREKREGSTLWGLPTLGRTE